VTKIIFFKTWTPEGMFRKLIGADGGRPETESVGALRRRKEILQSSTSILKQARVFVTAGNAKGGWFPGRGRGGSGRIIIK